MVDKLVKVYGLGTKAIFRTERSVCVFVFVWVFVAVVVVCLFVCLSNAHAIIKCRPEDNLGCHSSGPQVPFTPLFFCLNTGSLIGIQAPGRPGWLTSRPQVSVYFPLPRNGTTIMCHVSGFFSWASFLYLYRKHVSNGAIS